MPMLSSAAHPSHSDGAGWVLRRLAVSAVAAAAREIHAEPQPLRVLLPGTEQRLVVT